MSVGKSSKSSKSSEKRANQQVTIWVVAFVDEAGRTVRLHPEGLTEAGAQGFAESWNAAAAASRRQSGVGRVTASALQHVVDVVLE